jgi:hypothetical protein
MSFAEAIAAHCPYCTPRFFRGVDTGTIKATMEAKIWRLRGCQGMYPEFQESEIESYVLSAATQQIKE